MNPDDQVSCHERSAPTLPGVATTNEIYSFPEHFACSLLTRTIPKRQVVPWNETGSWNPIMKRIITFGLILGGIGALLAAIVFSSRSGHPVTPFMRQGADFVAGRKLEPLRDGLDIRPQVIVFILPDCPCSEDYEPFTHELYRAYGAHVDFLGIVAGTDAEAMAWQQQHRTPFPVLADPNGDIALSYDAQRSAYTALVKDRTVIQKLWPGYSSEMLQELGELAAAAAGISHVTLNTTAAPVKLTSGCYIGP